MVSYNQLIERIDAFYDAVGTRYDLLIPNPHNSQQNLAEIIKATCKEKGGASVCDIACFSGLLLKQLSSSSTLKLYGSDLNEKAIEKGKGRLGNKAVLRQSDWLDLSRTWSTNMFDVVVCTGNSLTHLPEEFWVPMLQEVRKILKPHGGIFIDTYRDWNTMQSTPITISPRDIRQDGDQLETATVVTYWHDLVFDRYVDFSRYQIKSDRNYLEHISSETCVVRHHPVYPDRLRDTLKKAGFMTIETLPEWDTRKFFTLFYAQ